MNLYFPPESYFCTYLEGLVHNKQCSPEDLHIIRKELNRPISPYSVLLTIQRLIPQFPRFESYQPYIHGIAHELKSGKTLKLDCDTVARMFEIVDPLFEYFKELGLAQIPQNRFILLVIYEILNLDTEELSFILFPISVHAQIIIQNWANGFKWYRNRVASRNSPNVIGSK